MKARIDLAYKQNNSCQQGCNKYIRKEITENDLCIKINSVSDNLPVRCVGKWATQKIFHLVQYFGIFANGMKDKWNLNYIEVCSGPGRCIARENGIEFDGTALAIIKHPAFKHLNKALFFDFNKSVVNALNQRIRNQSFTTAKAIIGDYYNPDEICQEIISEVDTDSLNMIFIDPTDCSVPFNLIRKIKRVLPNADLIINLASGTDYNRNIRNVLLDQKKYSKTINKYSRFLDSTDFFKDKNNLNHAKENNTNELRNSFRKYYTNSLMKIGYEYFDFKRIEHYYDILFASKHKTGITFWEKANKINFDGQRQLF